MRACASLVIVGSAFTTSRYASNVPRHCFDSRAARSSLITRSKLLRSAIGYLLRVMECCAGILPGRAGNGRAVLFVEPILIASITEPLICNKQHARSDRWRDGSILQQLAKKYGLF